MQFPRLNLRTVITVVAIITGIYMLGIVLQLPVQWVFALYLTAAGATVWMVFRILKDDYSTDKTFDEYFYQDREDIRRSGPD